MSRSWMEARCRGPTRSNGRVSAPRPCGPCTPSRVLSVAAAGGKKLEIRPARICASRTRSISRIPPSAGSPRPVVLSPSTYATHVAPARTFGFLSEYELLKQHGLARGASAENCIVVGEDRVENGSLRFPDEFVRHKVLDLLGDLALVGRPVVGHVVAHKAGHAMHASLAALLREDVRAESRGAEPAARHVNR